MFMIEKCVRHNVKAEFTPKSRHLWVQAWSGKNSHKSIIDNVDVDTAISVFVERTARVKTAPYRLRLLGENQVLAGKNVLDESYFERFKIHAVGFSELSERPLNMIKKSVGILVPCSGGSIVGAAETNNADVRKAVQNMAETLQSRVTSHQLTTRCNSNGESGGVFLITSPVDGILSNSDVGITYRAQSGQYSVLVKNKYLSDKLFGNKICPFTKLPDHLSYHKTIEAAMTKLEAVCRHATQDELAFLKM